ncbi:MAG: hypothetical protein RR065_01665 [Clostridia bacterium]
MRTAAIGIGSNSLRMLLADVDLEKNTLRRMERYREGLRVFAALDEQGNIEESMIERSCASVRGLMEEARVRGAQCVHLFATSAVRDAHNQQAFGKRLEQATGLELEICSGAQEAALSFWGATEGEHTGLIDIGGGSTEIVVGSGMQIDVSVSLQLGAVRLCRMQPIDSNATAENVVAVARSVLAPYRERFIAQAAEGWVGVGGTFTTLAAFVQRVPWDHRDKIHGFLLTRADAQAAMDTLAPMPLQERLLLPYLQPHRADIVVHGIAILLACMQALSIEVIQISECGNLEGYLKMKYLLH